MPEVKEPMEKEINNLIHFGVFEEVPHEDQKYIDGRWVVTRNEKHDGQKKPIKARLDAKDFQEENPPQSDSPTVNKQSVKIS